MTPRSELLIDSCPCAFTVHHQPYTFHQLRVDPQVGKYAVHDGITVGMTKGTCMEDQDR